MKSTTVAAILAFAGAATAQCAREGSFLLTFYGYPDNTPNGSAEVAHDCGGRNYVASGTATGTYDDPLTMATAPGELDVCEIIFVPYLEKYVRYEDDCEQCISDYNNGQNHIDVYVGPNEEPANTGPQLQCEDDLTPNDEIVIVRYPATTYSVDPDHLYLPTSSNPCRTDQTFPDNKAHTYCS